MSFRQSLAEDELIRADRFIKPRHQLRFVAARYGLRHVLAAYLNCWPASVRFDYSQRGKPILGSNHQSDIRFNLSHSADMAVVVVALGRDVGVDVEKVVNKANLQQLGDYAFNEDEKKLHAALSPARRRRGFYRLWTAKEAGLKMFGVGLGDMKKSITPGFGCFFVPTKDYIGAVAADDDILRVCRYRLELA